MCNTSNNNLSFKERVKCYISKRDEIEAEYKSRMKALNEEASADILANCPIKIGDVYTTKVDSYWYAKQQYYKVARIDADIDGTVSFYGYKRKLDGTWGKRDNNFMFITSVYENYNVGKYIKVENYVEPSKDLLIMKRSDKIKARKRIENGCNFPSLMKVSKISL